MKKTFVSMAFVAITLNGLFAQNFYGGNDPEPVATVSAENETHLSMEWRENENLLRVSVSGNFDPYTSISVMNQKGEEFFFEFVENGNNEYIFDLSEMENGSYRLLLNAGREIRIKRFVKN